jgi:hypothetical protein
MAVVSTDAQSLPLSQFRLRCFAAARALLIIWLAIFGIAAVLIIPAPIVFQLVATSNLYAGIAATALVILSGFVAPSYLAGRRCAEITPRRIWVVLALLTGVWGIDIAKECGAILFNATHARVELLPEETLADRAQAPAVIIYGTVSRRTPKMLEALAQKLRAQHPEGPAIKTLYLSSPGGDTKAILKTVEVARAAGVARTVAFGDCASGCAAMWLLMPQPELAAQSVVCFHGSHRTESSRGNRKDDQELQKAVLEHVGSDPAVQQQATAEVSRLFSHGLWELSCPLPAELREAGLLPSTTSDPIPYPEGVARFVSANPPGCLAPLRIPPMPPQARDPKQDGCPIP